MKRVWLCIFIGAILGGAIGFWLAWFHDLQPHIHGDMPDVFNEILAALFIALIGAIMGLLLAAILHGIAPPAEQSAPTSREAQDDTWPQPPAV